MCAPPTSACGSGIVGSAACAGGNAEEGESSSPSQTEAELPPPLQEAAPEAPSEPVVPEEPAEPAAPAGESSPEVPDPPPVSEEGIELGLEEIVTGLSAPVYVASTRGEQGRIYIVEQPGMIRIFENELPPPLQEAAPEAPSEPVVPEEPAEPAAPAGESSPEVPDPPPVSEEGIELGLEEIVTGLSAPVYVASTRGEQGRIYIVEQPG